MRRRAPTETELDEALSAFNLMVNTWARVGWIPTEEPGQFPVWLFDQPAHGRAPQSLRFRAGGTVFELRMKSGRRSHDTDGVIAARPISRHDVRRAFVIESPVRRPQAEPAF